MPIPIEKLKKVSVVYVHGKCPDGLASAMILKDAFRMLGTAPQIEFLVHDTEEHRTAAPINHRDDVVLFCDIAPHPASFVLCEGRSIVLDHHVGAREIVESFGEDGVYADAEKEPGVSGATLAYREVWKPVFDRTNNVTTQTISVRAVQDFAECMGVRDCWVTTDPRFLRGQYMSKAMMSKDPDHWLSPRQAWPKGATAGSSEDRWTLPYLTDGEVEVGRGLFDAHMLAVKQSTDQVVFFAVPNERGMREELGLKEPVGLAVFQEQVAGFRLTSDVADLLRRMDARNEMLPHEGWRDVHVVAGFSFVVDHPGAQPRFLVSLRGSHGFDVGAFAKHMGGGGHKAAAGFSCPVDELDSKGPYQHVRLALLDYLASRGG